MYPTQLFEAVLAIAASASVLPRVLRGDRSGEAALRCVLVYAVGRFLLELLKEQTGGAVLGLFAGQWVSMAVIVGCAVIGAAQKRRRGARWIDDAVTRALDPEAAPPEPANTHE